MNQADAHRLRSDLTDRRDELLELLSTLAGIESHASQRDGVAAVACVLCERLRAIGFEIEKVPQPGVPPEPVWVADVMSPGADYAGLGDTWVARRDGDGPDRLLLLGDLDTAFPPGSSRSFPFTVEEGRAKGPGVADMKGGLVVLVAALDALARWGLPTPPVTVVLSGDEQAGSFGSRVVIEREAGSARWCLCVECARQGGALMGARAQVGIGQVLVAGREAYGGDPTDRGVNAIEALSRLVPEINRLERPRDGVLVSVNLIRGGRRRSVIPAEARAIVDIRAPSAGEWDRVTAEIEALASQAGPGAEVSVETFSHRPAVEWTAATNRMLEVLQAAGRRIDLEVRAIRSTAAGSSAFAASRGVVTFDGMGPAGGGIMTHGEWVEVDSIPERGALLATAIEALPRSAI